MDSPRQVIGHQQIGLQRAAIAPEFQDDVDPFVQVLHDLAHHILVDLGLQKIETTKEAQLALDGPQCATVELALVQQGVQLTGSFLVALGQQLFDPALAQAAPQEIECADLHIGQTHQGAEHVHILWFDLVVADAHGEIELALPPP